MQEKEVRLVKEETKVHGEIADVKFVSFDTDPPWADNASRYRFTRRQHPEPDHRKQTTIPIHFEWRTERDVSARPMLDPGK